MLGIPGIPVPLAVVALMLRRTLPASPPSLLRFTVDIPKGAHLTFSYGIPEEP